MKALLAAAVLVALSLAGCGGKQETTKSARPVAAPPPRASEAAPASPVAAPSASGDAPAEAKERNPDLTALNAAYRKFWTEQKSPPAKLEDLVKRKYINSLPVPPKGKRFSVDWNRMEVTLVDQ